MQTHYISKSIKIGTRVETYFIPKNVRTNITSFCLIKDNEYCLRVRNIYKYYSLVFTFLQILEHSSVRWDIVVGQLKEKNVRLKKKSILIL